MSTKPSDSEGGLSPGASSYTPREATQGFSKWFAHEVGEAFGDTRHPLSELKARLPEISDDRIQKFMAGKAKPNPREMCQISEVLARTDDSPTQLTHPANQ